MPINDFLPWDAVGANVLSQADYLASTARINGVSAGPAKSDLANKTWRQSAAMAAMLGQFIADRGGKDARDDGNATALLSAFVATLRLEQPNFRPASATGDTVTLTMDPVISNNADVLGAPLRFLAPAAAIGPMNLQLGIGPGLGPISLLWGDGTFLAANDFVTGEFVEVYFDGTYFRRMGGVSPTRVKALIREARSANRIVRVFSASGTWTKAVGLLYATVAVLGGGASGGMSRSSTGTVFSGGGGGNGGYAEDVFVASELPASVPVTIGVGGASIAAGAPSGGNNGGSSAFGILASASGGLAGNGAEDNYGTGGNGGFGTDTARTSLLRLSGTRGSDGFLLAGGTFPTQFSGYGRGGQGGFFVTPTSAALASGAGQPGLVVVTEYY